MADSRVKLTATQLAAMQEIKRSITGRIIFGSGFGRYRVALRPLTDPKRVPALVTRTLPPWDGEEFALTPAGIAALEEYVNG